MIVSFFKYKFFNLKVIMFLATDEEESLEDPIPIRNMKRPEGKRAQIFLRYKDDPEKALVKVYGGWLRLVIFLIME